MTTDTIRTYAADVALNPAVGGYGNVQDCLAAGAGGAFIGGIADDTVTQDTPIALTGNGATTAVPCLIAAPPSWMNSTGHITVAGLYAIYTNVTATAGPTTATSYISVADSLGNVSWVPCAPVGAAGTATSELVIAVNATDLPVLVSSSVTMPTDVTEACTVSLAVSRLAYA